MSLDIKIGSYSFTDYIDTFEISQDSRLEQVTIPRRDGFLSDVAYKSGMSIRIGGVITCQDYNTTRSVLNSIKNALGNGLVVFTLFSDRQVSCQKTYFMSSHEEVDMRRIRWEAQLACDDFGFVDVDPTASERTISESPQTEAFVNNGNLETRPIIRITAGGDNIASGLRIDNTSTGKYCVINMVITAGNWIEIDSDLLTVVDQAAASKLAYFSGDFLKLAAGSNSIVWTGTAASSPLLKMTYRGKYDGA